MRKYEEECGLSLAEKQALPLEVKLAMTQAKIREWYDYWLGKVVVSFSGGFDSSVLLHIVRDMYPDVPAVFMNTGLEFPEIYEHVANTPNVIRLQPVKPFRWVIENEGYPILSKIVSKGIKALCNPSDRNYNYRHFLVTGIKKDGSISARKPLAEKWKNILNVKHDSSKGFYIDDLPFKVSNQCCDYLKKKPFGLYMKEFKQYPILGTMASEGGVRRESYNKNGCNRYTGAISSNPLSFWTQADVREYAKQNNVPISSIYSMGYNRTGCIYCMFGVHLDHRSMGGINRFQLLYDTHPKQWAYCMDKLGVRQVMEFLGLPIYPDNAMRY